MTMIRPEQLLLNLRPRPDARLADFPASTYAPVLEAANEVLQSPGGLLYVYGEPGLGRSHLLSALCTAAEEEGLTTVLLPFAELCREGPALLAGLEQQDLLACDDVEAVAGDPAWEEGLFHLFNRVRQAGGRLLFSARYLPGQCGFLLPDLVSRLAMAPVWELGLPDDAGRLALVSAAVERRGLGMEPGVLRYLAQRGPRSPATLLSLVERLDRHSLRAGRRLTIPFVRGVLEEAEPGI